ncbi:DUF637 domain-containing protein [Xenorhabdus cabanillasii]|uniref:DUF637 domain-containing protein n=1 Tax=Xenorhabdus cabanillasii TaxID=351673 RepID=UPI001FD146F4|nr:DUF637 domain-containing protein [Xenorhabdus cabanillasii]
MGGALAGFDSAMGWDKGSAAISKESMPILSSKDWIATAQRIAGHSLISSGINTTINGGSFKDNFMSTLLSNSVSQLHAEGANLIGRNGEILGDTGRLLSHGVLSAITAEIGGGDPLAAAVGSMAAEYAAISLKNTFHNEPEKLIMSGKVIGGLAGALISGTAEGVHSGADAAELAIIYNSLGGDKIRQQLEEDKELTKQLVREKNW